MPINSQKIILLKIYFFLLFWLIYFSVIPFIVVKEFSDYVAFSYSILFILLFSLGFYISLYKVKVNFESKINLDDSYKLWYLYLFTLVFSIAFHNIFTPLFAIISGHFLITRLQLNKKYQALFIIIISSLYLFNQFTRMFILMFYLYIFMYYYLRSKKIYLLNIVLLSIISQVLLIVMLYRRVFGEVDFDKVFGYLSNINGSDFLRLIDSYYVYEAYLRILKYFPRHEDFLYGYSYIKPFVFWIPRAIWENKPEGLSSLVVEKIYGTSKGSEYSTGFTLAGEFYANFGFVGMLICSLMIGLSIGFVSRKMISTKNEYTFVISLTTIIYFPHIARGGILETTILFLIIFYLIFMLFFKTKNLYKKIKLFKE